MLSLPISRAKLQTRLIYEYACKFEVLVAGIVTVLHRVWGTEVLALIWILRGYCTEVHKEIGLWNYY